MFDFKGQGALEYLLLIGGAVLVAVIVVSLLLGTAGTTKESQEAQFILQQLKIQCDSNVLLYNITSTQNQSKCTGPAVPPRNCNQFNLKDSKGVAIVCSGT